MALELDVGELVTPPVTGRRKFRVNGDGELEMVNPDGTASAIAGGGSSWFDDEAAAHLEDVPALTDSVPIIVGSQNVAERLVAAAVAGGALAAADAGVEGGALKGTGGAFACLTKANIWQNPKTSNWAVSFKCRIGAIDPGRVSYIGLGNAAGSSLLVFGSDPSRHAANFIFFGFNGANTTIINTGIVADAATRSIRATSNGTTTRVYIDGVQVGTLTNGSEANYPTAAVLPLFHATASFAGGQAVWDCVYSFTRP